MSVITDKFFPTAWSEKTTVIQSCGTSIFQSFVVSTSNGGRISRLLCTVLRWHQISPFLRDFIPVHLESSAPGERNRISGEQMLRPALFYTVLLISTLIVNLPAQAQNRIALVIGNSSYKTAPLPNPVNDATLMTRILKKTGFNVTTVLDADQKTMKRALVEFGRKLRNSDAVGLFYYAGHGVQVRDENYLIPIGFNIQDESELAMEAIKLSSFLGTIERQEGAINIIILDACRNNPFPRSFKSVSSGLARVSAPRGSFIAYATAPGQVSYDGILGNSPYTTALSKAITTPGLTIEQVFKQTRREVTKTTQDRQIPWEDSSITRDFHFMRQIQVSKYVEPEPPALVLEENAIRLTPPETEKGANNRSVLNPDLQNFSREIFSNSALKQDKDHPVKKRKAAQPHAVASFIKNRRSLTQSLQKELARIGCSPGRIDGKWGAMGKSAMEKFNHFSGRDLDVSTASPGAYHAMKKIKSRVCPRSCTAQSRLKNGQCVIRNARLKPQARNVSRYKGGCGIFKGKRFCL